MCMRTTPTTAMPIQHGKLGKVYVKHIILPTISMGIVIHFCKGAQAIFFSCLVFIYLDITKSTLISTFYLINFHVSLLGIRFKNFCHMSSYVSNLHMKSADLSNFLVCEAWTKTSTANNPLTKCFMRFTNRIFFFCSTQVNSAFNRKRKMLRRSLQHICSALEIEAALMNVGLPNTVSPLWAKLIGFSFLACRTGNAHIVL